MSRPLVVELCGLPGSGKSVLADALVRVLHGRGVPAVEPAARVGPEVPTRRRLARKLAMSVQESTGHGAVSRAVLREIAASGQQSRGDDRARSVQWLVTQHLLRAARGGRGVQVVDEGLLQALWSVGLRGEVRGVLEALARHADAWERPDIVIVVDAPVVEVIRRLELRPSGHSRTQHLPPADRIAELVRGQDLLDDLVAWWTDLAGEDRLVRTLNADRLPPASVLATVLTGGLDLGVDTTRKDPTTH